jgi:predicted amidohydrolase YtcJ
VPVSGLTRQTTVEAADVVVRAAKVHVIHGGLNCVLELRGDGVVSLCQGLAMLVEQAARPANRDEWLRLNGAGENLPWAAADVANVAQSRPELLAGYEANFDPVRLLMENGWGCRLHATHEETIRRDLAVCENLAADALIPAGNRWLSDHAEPVCPGTLDRIAALGGAMSVQAGGGTDVIRVAHYSGYQATVKPRRSAARQAGLPGPAAAGSRQDRQWRARRRFPAPTSTEIFSACFPPERRPTD